MGLQDDFKKDVLDILNAKWQSRDGIVVPESDDVKLGNDAVKIDGTVLYADLAESTKLVSGYKYWFAAEMYKVYLECACRIIRQNNGVVTAFDGDRVMAVFIDAYKNSSAAKTALQINYAVEYIINPLIKEKYPKDSYVMNQSVGIDTGSLYVAKTGIRNSNDLVWVGRPANYAAKLCSLRNGYNKSFITTDVYNALNESAKYDGGNPKRDMWESVTWTEYGISIYRSSYWMRRGLD